MIMNKNFRMPNIKTTHKPNRWRKAKRNKKEKKKWINIRKNLRMWTKSQEKVVTNNKSYLKSKIKTKDRRNKSFQIPLLIG